MNSHNSNDNKNKLSACHNPTTNAQLQTTSQANRTKEIAERLTRDADTLKMQPQVAAITVDPVDVSSRAATVSCHGTWWQAFSASAAQQHTGGRREPVSRELLTASAHEQGPLHSATYTGKVNFG